MPSWGFGGLLGDGAALCSFLTWNSGAGSMCGLFKPLSICFGGAGGLDSLHLSSLLFDSLGIPLRLLGGSDTFNSSLPPNVSVVSFFLV